MSDVLWKAEVTSVGHEAGEMLEAGILILFSDPVPDALADVSVTHNSTAAPARPLRAGDQFSFSGQAYVIDEVGGRTYDNLAELGHVVVYVDEPDQELLPGAVKVTGPALVVPEMGSNIEFVGA